MTSHAAGRYTGNGSTSGPSVTLGFRPCAVFIQRTDSSRTWNITLDVGGTLHTKNASNGALVGPDLSFNATGFQVIVTDLNVNASGGTYNYVALQRDSATCDSFSFTGDGTNNRNVGALAFQPDVAFYFSSATERGPYWKVTGSGTTSSYFLDGTAAQAPSTTGIVAFTSSGITVSAQCNPNTATVYILALKNTATLKGQVYVGNGTAGHTIAHGVGATPIMVMVQNITGQNDECWRATGDGTGNVAYPAGGGATTGILTAIDGTNVTLGTSTSSNTNASNYAMLALAAELAVSVSGTAATAAVGSVNETDSELLGAVVGTGAVGTPVDATSVAASGLAASGAVGTAGAESDLAVSGLSASGAVGAVGMESDIATSGDSATGAAGTLTAENDASAGGVASTGSAGNVGTEADLPLSGDEATGAAGSPAGATSSEMGGVTGSGAPGTPGPDLAVALTGAAATGAVGTVVTPGGVTVAITGVSSVAAVGSMTATQPVAPSDVGGQPPADRAPTTLDVEAMIPGARRMSSLEAAVSNLAHERVLTPTPAVAMPEPETVVVVAQPSHERQARRAAKALRRVERARQWQAREAEDIVLLGLD